MNIPSNVLFGILLIFFGLFYLRMIFRMATSNEWIEKYIAGAVGTGGGIHTFRKYFLSPRGKKITKYFVIPLGFIIGIAIIAEGILIILKIKLSFLLFG